MSKNEEKRRCIIPNDDEDETEKGIFIFQDPAGTKYKASTVNMAIDQFVSERFTDNKTSILDLKAGADKKGASVLSRRFEQRIHGLPLLGARLRVVADRRRKSVVQATNTLDYDVAEAPLPESAIPIEEVQSVILAPFSEDYHSAEITKSSLAYLRYTQRPTVPMGQPDVSLSLLTIGKEADGELHLIYDSMVVTSEPEEGFQVLVDAITGELLYVKSLSRWVTSSMYVYSPDPISDSNDGTLSSASSATDLNQFREEVHPEINAATNGIYRLEGEWIRCAELQSPTFAQPQENTSTFKYSTDPIDRRFLSCNVYYWLDKVIRYLRTLGVQEFNNATTEAIKVDPQALSGADNSKWRSWTDPPSILHGEGGVPDAADMAVVIHEYAHGMFHFLGSDHGGSRSYEHSVCDALPAIFRDRFNTSGHRRTEVFPWDNNTNNQWSSVRTLNRKERFDDTNFNTYDFNLRNSMLGTVFWDCYEGMAGYSTNTLVRKKAADAMIRTMMEMLLIVPDDSSIGIAHAQSMAEGCMTADTMITGGLYSKVMYDACVKRGLFDPREVDVYITDSLTDTGEHPSPLPHSTSPDIWVRNNAPPADSTNPNDPNAGEDPDVGHQLPINDQLNYMYVRVHNRGSKEALANTFQVEAFLGDSGTGMIWPEHFDSMGTLTITQSIPVGGSVRVGPFIWTPHIQDHESLLAIVQGTDDPAISQTLLEPVEHWMLVRFDNNVGQRNVNPQD